MIHDANELTEGLSKFPSEKWHQLGVVLNLPTDTLKIIEQHYLPSGRVKSCLSETLRWWYNNNSGGATWVDICAALLAVDEGALATVVAIENGKPLSTLFWL